MELEKLTAAQVAEAVRKKEISARELTETALTRCATLNSTLNSFIHIFEESALMQAEAVDEKIKQGENLPLAGVPAAVKDDLWCSFGPTTCGSASLQDFVPPDHAFSVQKLIDAGAVIVGKTNLDQLGLGSTTTTSYAGATANPYDLGRYAGDGGAAAVSSGQCLLALSSDTGGALRMGAAYCGMFGLRSTTGLISRHGLNTFAPSFARVGVIAKDAADLPVALKALSGGDLRDAATAAVKEIQPGSASEISISNLKIGYPSAVFNLLSGGTAAALKAAIEEFKGLGVEIVEINLPHFSEALQSYYVIAAAEASSNFGRFDGIRFGAPHDGKDLEEWYSKTRSVTLGPEGKRRSVIGTYMLSKDSFERYYRHAQKVWALVKNEFHQALKNCDTIILPAASGPAELLSAAGSFIDAYTEDLFCAPVSLSGLPALTLPGGEVEAAPVGMQLVGQPFAEMALASIALHFASRIQLPPITVL